MTCVYCEIFVLQKIYKNRIIKGLNVKDHSGKACFIGLMYSQAGQLANGSQLQWVISQWSLITMQAAEKMLVTGDDVCHSKKVSNTRCHHLRLIQGPLLTGILVARIQIKSFNMLASAETSFGKFYFLHFIKLIFDLNKKEQRNRNNIIFTHKISHCINIGNSAGRHFLNVIKMSERCGLIPVAPFTNMV